MADVKLEIIDLSTGLIIGTFSLDICTPKAYELDLGNYRFKSTYLPTGEIQTKDINITEGTNQPINFTFIPTETPPPTLPPLLIDHGDSLIGWGNSGCDGHAFPDNGYNTFSVDTVDKPLGTNGAMKLMWAVGGPTWGGGAYVGTMGGHAPWNLTGRPILRFLAKIDKPFPIYGKMVAVLAVTYNSNWDTVSYDLVSVIPVGNNYFEVKVDLRLHQPRTDGKLITFDTIMQFGFYLWNELIVNGQPTGFTTPLTMHICEIYAEEGAPLPLEATITPIVPVTIVQGGNQAFTAQVRGGLGPIIYKWYVNNILQPVTTASFTFTGTSLGDFTVLCEVTDGVTIITVSQTVTVAAPIIPTLPNAMLIYDQGWVEGYKNVLDNMPKVINDLSSANCKYVILFIGYYSAVDPTHPTVPWVRTAAFYRNVIDQLHAIGCKVIAWIENGSVEYGDGVSDISPANWTNITPLITQAMNMGFDGYLDDIEVWTTKPTGMTYEDTVIANQQQIAWLNYLTLFLHNGANFADGKPRLNMPAVSFDWTQTLNQHLIVDYICSMFYDGAVPSTLEDPQCEAFWQENFGEYNKAIPTPPASPMILTIINWRFNNQPLSWQLAKIDYLLTKYPHPNLYGFAVWILENMGTIHPEDWTVWNAWVNTLPSKGVPPTTNIQHFLTISSTENGTTDPSIGIYNAYENTSYQVLAIPATGYMLDHWKLDGIAVSTASSYSVFMDTDHELLAVFVEMPPPPPGKHNITISATVGGTTLPETGTWEFNEGVSIQVLAKPDNEYSFDHFELDGVASKGNPITITMNIDHNLLAVFIVKPVPIPLWKAGAAILAGLGGIATGIVVSKV